MSKAKDNKPIAETPLEFTGIKVTSVEEKAAGIPAIYTSLKHATKYIAPSQLMKTMFKVNQKGGFDCPGCAWPDPDDDRSALGEYCENGIKAIAEEAQAKKLNSRFFKENSVYSLSLMSDFQIGKLGRLTEPLILDEANSHYRPISWDDAISLVAQKLNQLDSPDEAVFYTSGRTSNEAAYLYQLFVRAFGTNNLPDCSNMCHESSGQGLSQTLGIGKGSVTLEDIYEAELIMVIGQNPGTNHPRMLTALEKCKHNGGKIITVNPIPEAGLMKFVNPQRPLKMLTGGTTLTDLYLPVTINGDVALLKAIMKMLLVEEKNHPNKVLDHEFIKSKTEGFESFLSALQNLDLKDSISRSGIDESLIRQAVDLIKFKSKIIICWAMGLTQHVNAVDNIKEIVNLLLMKGAIGKPGAGTCPVRGHSNVQGDRTMGIWEAPKEAFLNRLQQNYGFSPPRHHGYAVVDAIKAMHEEKAKIFFAMGGNFISATPDTNYTAEALRNCELTVHVSTKLNRSHLVHGKTALILPCLGRTEIDIQSDKEQFVSVENSMGIVHSSKGVLQPASDKLKSEVSIVSQLASKTLGDKVKIDWLKYAGNYDLIREDIEKVIPGFENYNKRVRSDNGFYLPNGAREAKFNTASKKAQFSVIDLPSHNLAEDEFAMMTIRSHDQYNTTIYGLDDRYRGIYNERRVIMMNEEDMHIHSLKKADVVDLSSQFEGRTRTVKNFIVVPYPIPKRCVASYFPETNPLVPINLYAKGSKTPASKFVPIRINKVNI